MSTFAQSFWNESLQDFSGFEILVRRLKSGRRAWKDYIEYLKHRAQVHDNYGKSLIKVAKLGAEKNENGTLREVWSELSLQTEKTGCENLSLANSLNEEAHSQTQKLQNCQDRRKCALTEVRKLQLSQKGALKRVDGEKKLYYLRCKQADQIGQMLLVDMGKANIHPKDIEKLKLKHSRCLQIADQADTAYQNALKSLEETRQLWETETIVGCQVFQEIEEERIKCIRDSLWLIGNIFSAQTVKEDDHQEKVRKSIENLDSSKDIQQFVKEHQTGCQKPGPVLYEPYRSDNQQQQCPAKINCPEAIYAQVDKAKKKPKDQNIQKSEINYCQTEMELYESSDIFETYAWRVLRSYSANGSYEISLNAEDYVQVTNQTNPDWWQVQTIDGKKGYFPSKYLEYGAHIDIV